MILFSKMAESATNVVKFTHYFFKSEKKTQPFVPWPRHKYRNKGN